MESYSGRRWLSLLPNTRGCFIGLVNARGAFSNEVKASLKHISACFPLHPSIVCFSRKWWWAHCPLVLSASVYVDGLLSRLSQGHSVRAGAGLVARERARGRGGAGEAAAMWPGSPCLPQSPVPTPVSTHTVLSPAWWMAGQEGGKRWRSQAERKDVGEGRPGPQVTSRPAAHPLHQQRGLQLCD